MAGRPTKLTPAIQERIVTAIRLGATYEMAAQYGGITYQTFKTWMQQGEKADKGQFSSFFKAVGLAESDAVVGWLAKIEKAANEGTWQAAAWKLERRYPREYGKNVIEQEHSGKLKIEIVRGDVADGDQR